LGAEPSEERMNENLLQTTLQLNNGHMLNVRCGLLYYNSLKTLSELEPEIFRSVLSLARDPSIEIQREHLDRVKQIGGILQPDGAIKDAVRNVLTSSYQETTEGPVLINPFIIKNTELANEIESIERTSLIWPLGEIYIKDDIEKSSSERPGGENRGR
jgi:hypothetical protein